jgi:hypothetical protein
MAPAGKGWFGTERGAAERHRIIWGARTLPGLEKVHHKRKGNKDKKNHEIFRIFIFTTYSFHSPQSNK